MIQNFLSNFLPKLLLLFAVSPSLVMAEVPSFADLEKVLKSHVVEKKLPNGGFESSFNYQKAYDDADTLAAVASQKKILAGFDPAKISTKNEALSFWINTYNFFMITKIFNEGFKKGKLKINSVKDLGSWLNKYAAFTEKDFVVGGTKMHLDDFEKGWLLSASGDFKDKYKGKKWKDARIHFAVNCASVGCPPLRNFIYTPENVDRVLNENTKMAFLTSRHLQFKGDKLWLTHLFKWYKDDFKGHSGSVKSFIVSFIEDEKLKKKINSVKNGDFEYIEYDWKLNRPENF